MSFHTDSLNAGLNDSVAMVPFQTYPFPNGGQESVCRLCNESIAGPTEQIRRWILKHREWHLRRALAGVEAAVASGSLAILDRSAEVSA